MASFERSVMYRERAAGMYSELPFALAQCLIELPYNLAQAMIFSCTSYFMLGFDHTAGGLGPSDIVVLLCIFCCCCAAAILPGGAAIWVWFIPVVRAATT